MSELCEICEAWWVPRLRACSAASALLLFAALGCAALVTGIDRFHNNQANENMVFIPAQFFSSTPASPSSSKRCPSRYIADVSFVSADGENVSFRDVCIGCGDNCRNVDACNKRYHQGVGFEIAATAALVVVCNCTHARLLC